MTDLEVSSTEAIADWIETSVLVSSSGHFGRDKLDDLASTEIGASPMKVAMAIDTMAKRASVLGASYPFVVSDIAVLRRKSRHAGHYAALLYPDAGLRGTPDRAGVGDSRDGRTAGGDRRGGARQLLG